MTELEEFREQKDAIFRTGEQSPLMPSQRAAFAGLNYYPEAPELAFELTPEPFDDAEPVEMQTSTGETATYLRWGSITFEVAGKPVSLTLFADPGGGGFFLPFQDAGRGSETYGAGRYLDVEAAPEGRLHVDFNYAYNPYCAYNDAWSCPIPPRENMLAVHIRAGEMSFHPES